ncbi:GspE/PulE family protein [Mariniblastus fucicola]|uniref:Type II/IV secretion system protein n=1 Tax=Mariniblastus fucicola TaxID=980251 RepID=A0A5B9P6R7_9BACT|nr:ATPase, T2SS/T4P/T4SS family [Mariniblastus fucicola]QEG20620.1 Type II/IV secretion system protein [Mariniblastus fucicola]
MALDGFGKFLVKNKLVTQDQVLDADELSRQNKISLTEAIFSRGYMGESEATQALAKYHRMEFVDLSEVEIPESVIELMPETVARENAVIPISETGTGGLKVLMSDPNDVDTIENLRFILNRDVSVALAPKSMIIGAINTSYGQMEGESADSILQEFTDTAIDFTETVEDGNDMNKDEVDESSSAIVRLVQLMVTEAVQVRASDIHVEPFEDRVRIRYRIDGVLHERDTLPKRQLGAIISRIKILAKIDIAERRREQDGRIKVSVGEKELDLRVSIIPTNNGQSAVLRLLDKDNIKIGVRQLGFSERTYKQFMDLTKRPNGIILVTGPTGSGKTTTLYAALNSLNRPDRKIITAEDPVEYYLPGINQVEVKHKIGLDFARIIRSMLRQAPNVILVGEMRDAETASMGIQASLTGHLVFSTLHTNDAPTAITRMIDIGVPGYLVASSVVAILAQRLVRTICKKCGAPYTPPEHQIHEAGLTPEEVAGATFRKGKGCNSCQKTGYRGRVGIYEMLIIDAKIRQMIFDDTPTNIVREYAISKGMSTLYMDGLAKVMGGVTTLEEVFRVAKKTEQDDR